jgi:hypothetical protein
VDPYNSPVTSSLKEEELKEELARIRNTASFQFGFHFVQAAQRPWKILALPVTTPLLLFKLLRKKKKQKRKSPLKLRDCILVFSTESVRGLHHDRSEALIGNLSNRTTQLIHVTTEANIPNGSDKTVLRYTIPSRAVTKNMSAKVWNQQCETMLNCILDVFAPKTFVFDGDYPFRGMLNAISIREGMNRYWIRESPNNHKISQLPLDGFEIFDAILHPSITKTTDPDVNIGRSGSIFCNPIIGSTPQKEDREAFRSLHTSDNVQLIFVDIGPTLPIADLVISSLQAQENLRLLIRPQGHPKSLLSHPKTVVAHDLSYAEALAYADAAVLYPDQYSLHTAINAQTPTLSIFNSSSTKSGVSEPDFAGDLPLIHLDQSLDEKLILEAIQRLIDPAVQLQLKQQLSEVAFSYDQQKLTNFLMQLHQ